TVGLGMLENVKPHYTLYSPQRSLLCTRSGAPHCCGAPGISANQDRREKVRECCRCGAPPASPAGDALRQWLLVAVGGESLALVLAGGVRKAGLDFLDDLGGRTGFLVNGDVVVGELAFQLRLLLFDAEPVADFGQDSLAPSKPAVIDVNLVAGL